MSLEIVKDSIDLGIIVQDLDLARRFYCDTLGFEELDGRSLESGAMCRLLCGTSVIKLVSFDSPPPLTPSGGVRGATGYRYWTVTVADVKSAVAEIAAAGYDVPVPVTEIRPNVFYAMVADPDGNWVELLEER